MKDILKNLKLIDNLESGKKSLTESAIAECGGDMPPAVPAQQGNPVTASITLNASGVDNVMDLMKLLKDAGVSQVIEPTEPSMGMRADIEKFRSAVDAPAMPQESEWVNEPGEEYSGHNLLTKDLSGGLNGPKKMHKPAAAGDNPMAVAEKEASPELINQVQQLNNIDDINVLKKQILNILNTAKINPKTKPSLLRNIQNSKTRDNLLGLAWNTFILGKEGHHAIGSNWKSRHGISDDVQVESVKERLYKALTEKKANESEAAKTISDKLKKSKPSYRDPNAKTDREERDLEKKLAKKK